MIEMDTKLSIKSLHKKNIILAYYSIYRIRKLRSLSGRVDFANPEDAFRAYMNISEDEICNICFEMMRRADDRKFPYYPDGCIYILTPREIHETYLATLVRRVLDNTSTWEVPNANIR